MVQIVNSIFQGDRNTI